MYILYDWICEAYKSIQKAIKEDVIIDFYYSKEENLNTATEYLKALRSYVIAHPLSTNRHKQYELDGSFICVDIRTCGFKALNITTNNQDWHHLDINGLHHNAKKYNFDFVLYSYIENSDKSTRSQVIGVELADIYKVAELYIDKLYELDNYLKKTTKRMVATAHKINLE